MKSLRRNRNYKRKSNRRRTKSNRRSTKRRTIKGGGGCASRHCRRCGGPLKPDLDRTTEGGWLPCFCDKCDLEYDFPPKEE
jgi:hypothetical protein